MVVPRELEKLALYRKDEKLCARWTELLEAWEAAFPGVDIANEVAKAHAWEIANPERQKVRRARFLTNWLTRAQDRGSRTYQPSVQAPPPVTNRDLLLREISQYRDKEIVWSGEASVVARDGLWRRGGFRLWSTIGDVGLAAILMLAKEVKVARDLERRIQEDGQKEAQVLPQPEVGSDRGRDYF